MKCEQMKELWKKYVDGTILESELQQLEKHLEQCKDCEKYLHTLIEEEPLMKQSPLLPPTHMQHSLRKLKWKQRMTNVLLTIAALVFLFITGSILSALYYGTDNKRMTKITDVPILVFESMMPNAHIGSGGTNVKPFFLVDSSFDFSKQLGYDEIPIGQLQINGLFSTVTNVERHWTGGSYTQKLFFAYPNTKTDIHYDEQSQPAWNTLEKLPEGTVSELAISFDQSYSLSEAQTLLSNTFGTKEDAPIPVWYALDTGTENKYTRSEIKPYLSSLELFGFPSLLDLRDFQDHNNDTQEQRVVKMMKIFSENEKTVQRISHLPKNDLRLSERYQYVKKNGVNVYGVVLTGPTKELLKLKNAKNIRFATIGDVTFWNWTHRPVSGTIY